MTHHPTRRNSLRLKGFDYSQPGGYFVTICTRHRRCVLGDVVDGRMMLSEVGTVVERCWMEMPGHFRSIRLHTFQIMPNHVHGVIEIVPSTVIRRGLINQTCTGVQLNARTENSPSRISPKEGTLGVVIRTFKAAVTTELRRIDRQPSGSIWHRNYYDHIIRDDTDWYFVQQYIELNPLMWELDRDNSVGNLISLEGLRERLKAEHGLTGPALERAVEHEENYRHWWESELQEQSSSQPMSQEKH